MSMLKSFTIIYLNVEFMHLLECSNVNVTKGK